MRVALFILAGASTMFAESSVAPSDVVKRLQPEEPELPSLPQDVRRLQDGRRRNAWNDFSDIFVDIGDWVIDLDDVFVGAWDSMDQFFTEDMVHWFEDDFVNFWEDLGNGFADTAGTEWDNFMDFTDMTGEWFVGAWDTTMDGMSTAWTWTKNAGETAWEWTEDAWDKLNCMVEDIAGSTCIECVEEACNSNLSEDLINQIDAANGVAIMDMNNEFDYMINGCTAALEKCPPITVCNDFYNMSPATQQYVQPQIAQCNMCYQCLPFGSSRETCKVALDQLMPNECAECDDGQLQMYQAFYSCSGIQEMYDSIENLGNEYKEGGTGRESLDQMCKYCANCSDYKTELQDACMEWAQIKQDWDCMPPTIPEALDPNGVLSSGSSGSSSGSSGSN